MRAIILIFITLSFIGNATAQSIAPGGVQDFLLWGTVHDTEKDQSFKVITPKNDSLRVIELQGNPQSFSLFNFHPALDMGEVETLLDFSLAEYDLSQMSLIAVLDPIDSVTERSVWFLEKNSKTSLISTTHRTVDLTDESFMNFLNHQPELPVINTFMQFKNRDTLPQLNQRLVLGKHPVLPELPVESFKGLLAEVIVYNRVLSLDERIRIESYLAVKYGLTLSLPGNGEWLDSEGKVIFKSLPKQLFSSRTFAVGRDDATGLYQKQSKSSYGPSLLTIGVGKIEKENNSNNSILENASFRFFADDNAPTVLGEKEMGKPHFLQKKWRTTSVGEVENLDFEILLDTRLTNGRLQEGESWWLAIDRSGKGNFEAGNTEYFPATEFLDSKTVRFSKIIWSGKDVFTFGIAPNNSEDWNNETLPPASLNDDFSFIELYPNPAPSGRFQVAIALKANADASLHITDVSGKTLLLRQLKGSKYYFENLHLNTHPGIYLVSIYSGQSMKSFPLIID